MKKQDFALIGFSLFLLLCVTGCVGGKINSLQTQIHDIGVRIEMEIADEAAWKNVKEDCVIRQITFSEDSFGFYLHCPNEAKPLRKIVIKNAYHLMK